MNECCARRMHQGCLNKWQTRCDEGGLVPTCPMCRGSDTITGPIVRKFRATRKAAAEALTELEKAVVNFAKLGLVVGNNETSSVFRYVLFERDVFVRLIVERDSGISRQVIERRVARFKRSLLAAVVLLERLRRTVDDVSFVSASVEHRRKKSKYRSVSELPLGVLFKEHSSTLAVVWGLRDQLIRILERGDWDPRTARYESEPIFRVKVMRAFGLAEHPAYDVYVRALRSKRK